MSYNNRYTPKSKKEIQQAIYLLNEDFYTTEMTKEVYLSKLFPLQRALLYQDDSTVYRD